MAAAIQAWATPMGGQVKVVANMQHLWEEIYPLTTAPDGTPRVLIVFTGSTPREGFNTSNTAHREDRQWTVVILRGHGWKNYTTETGTQGEAPFYDVVESLRDLLRIQQVTEEPPIDYKGIKSVPNLMATRGGNVFLDGYAIDFSTANDIPYIGGMFHS